MEKCNLKTIKAGATISSEMLNKILLTKLEK